MRGGAAASPSHAVNTPIKSAAETSGETLRVFVMPETRSVLGPRGPSGQPERRTLLIDVRLPLRHFSHIRAMPRSQLIESPSTASVKQVLRTRHLRYLP